MAKIIMMNNFCKGRSILSNFIYNPGSVKQLHKDNRKRVIDLNTNIVYESMGDAADACGLSRTLLNKIVHEKEGYSEYKGFKFRLL